MKRRLLFFLCCINFFCSKNTGQTLPECIVFAQEQTKGGNYYLAAKTMERVAFFAPDSLRHSVYASLAELYAGLGRTDKSILYYDRLFFTAPNDSLRQEAVFGKTAQLLQARAFNNALIELYALDDSLTEGSADRRALFLAAAYFGLGKFGHCEAELLRLATTPSEQEGIRMLLRKAQKHQSKSPKAARIMSMIVPGLGQAYAGDWKNALNSFFLNVGLMAWFVSHAQAYTLLDSGATAGPWFFRYYNGGFQRAERIMVQRKIERLNATFQQILDLLEHPAEK